MDAQELLDEKIRNVEVLLIKIKALKKEVDWDNISSETEEILYEAIKSLTFT